MNLKNQTVCFTGHREIKHEKCEKILIEIVEDLIIKGFRFFGAGGARGFDSLAEKVVLTLKETKYPHIHLILVFPFENQYLHETGWSKEEIDFYHYAKNKASKVVHLNPTYESGIYYKRNRHLVDNSSLCVAYQYKSTGGTAYTTNYAKNAGVQVLYLRMD